MRRTRRRRSRSVRRTARTLVLTAVAVAAFVAIAPPAWVDAKRAMRGHLDALEDVVGPAAQRTADWLGGGVGTVRDALAQGVAGATVSGPARVVVDDTLEVRGTRVRLNGIDAPESKQRCRSAERTWPCGQEATRALARRIGSRTVACEERDQDRYGRIVALCRVGGEDVNTWMAAEGWAFAYRKYSTQYVAEETVAKVAKRGIRRGDVVAPWEWRKGKRLAGTQKQGHTAASRQGSGRCTIKGNIGKSGTRIYHVPGGRFYDRTRIDTSKGERWFCTEVEARTAGWRRSRQ